VFQSKTKAVWSCIPIFRPTPAGPACWWKSAARAWPACCVS